MFEFALVRSSSKVSQAKARKKPPAVAPTAPSTSLRAGFRRGSGDVSHGFSGGQGFHSLLFYLPVCANGGLFSANPCGGVDGTCGAADAFGKESFPGPKIRSWCTRHQAALTMLNIVLY